MCAGPTRITPFGAFVHYEPWLTGSREKCEPEKKTRTIKIEQQKIPELSEPPSR